MKKIKIYKTKITIFINNFLLETLQLLKTQLSIKIVEINIFPKYKKEKKLKLSLLVFTVKKVKIKIKNKYQRIINLIKVFYIVI